MEPLAKKRKDDNPTRRFSDPCFSCYVPKNTSKATNWALAVFNTWREQRGELEDGICPSDLLELPRTTLLIIIG